jgi:hypothetical protein
MAARCFPRPPRGEAAGAGVGGSKPKEEEDEDQNDLAGTISAQGKIRIRARGPVLSPSFRFVKTRMMRERKRCAEPPPFTPSAYESMILFSVTYVSLLGESSILNV